nr:EOG090X0BCY [Polyphemus pediculus]
MFDLLAEGENSGPNTTTSEESESEIIVKATTTPTGAKSKKKFKRKTPKKSSENDVDLEEFLIENPSPQHSNPVTTVRSVQNKFILSLEQKLLNPDNELKKIFGSKVIQSNQKKKARGRAYVKSSWLMNSKENWAQIKKTGLSMSLDHSKDGLFYFKYEHNKEYRTVQLSFWEAVSSLDPSNIVSLLNVYPFHIDALIQLSDICRMSEEAQRATELIERALYILESAFHPSFILSSGNCRLEYKHQENRGLFLTIFKHLVCIGQKGCYRTALEFCKLLYTLDLENDPLAVILMIDFYAIKAQEYAWFIEFFNHYEPTKNLSQLPNLAYAIALAHFHHSKVDPESLLKSEAYLREALLMFPAVLIPLLEKCSIQADSRVMQHPYFSPITHTNQPPSLNNLVQLYVGRSFHTWKEPEILPWLERVSNQCIDEIDRDPSMTLDYDEKRKKRYQGTPRNIYRHIILSEIKDATATLPQDLSEGAVLGFDPLPPLDSVSSYSRPRNATTTASQTETSLLGAFLRSLLPGYNPQEIVNDPVQNARGAMDEAEDPEVEGAGANLQRNVNALVNAMRDLISNIHLPDIQDDGESEDVEEFD